jgi:cell division protein ZapE
MPSETTPRVPAAELTLDAIPTEATPAELVRGFVPTPRFAHVTFDSYRPAPDEPTQAAALARVREFVAEVSRDMERGGGLFARFRRPKATGLHGLYLDGGFGVGKTHLLAAAYHAAPPPKAYLSFAELSYTITALGMQTTLEALCRHRLLCLDEFELDDVANTRLAATFLRGLRDAGSGTRVLTTSNTLPSDLGAGRFAAENFRHEIGDIAAAFEAVHIEGEDYRRRPRWEGAPAGEVLSDDALRAAYARYRPPDGAKLYADFPTLLARLAELHPIRYVRLLAPLDAVFLEGLGPIGDQNNALRFVHFVDKLYDEEVRLAVSASCPLPDLFLPEYRHLGYAKKYLRCLSRLHELLTESATERLAER